MKNIEYVRPQDIEKRSFAIISKELDINHFYAILRLPPG